VRLDGDGGKHHHRQHELAVDRARQLRELGTALQWSFSERISGTAAYSHYFIPPREVDDSLHQPLAEPSLDAFNHPSPTGTYDATSDYLTLSMSVVL